MKRENLKAIGEVNLKKEDLGRARKNVRECIYASLDRIEGGRVDYDDSEDPLLEESVTLGGSVVAGRTVLGVAAIRSVALDPGKGVLVTVGEIRDGADGVPAVNTVEGISLDDIECTEDVLDFIDRFGPEAELKP